MSVVVSTYNRRHLLEAMLEPLLADAATTEIVVVVDGCRDGSYEVLAELAATDARIRPLFIENAGQSGARATGVEAATGEVVLLLDDDVVAAPGLVTGHARWHATTRDRVVVGYMPTHRPPRRGRGMFATYLYADEYEARCTAYEADAGDVLRHLWGGNVSLWRADALRVGVSAGRFARSKHEDREFGIRCLEAGLSGVFDRSLRAAHVHHRPLAAFLEDARMQGSDRWVIASAHPDIAGAPTLASFDDGLPVALRRVLRWCDVPAVGGVVRALGCALVELSGSLRLFHVETAAARVLRRMEHRRGARAAGAM
jgi:glycosyltransferase involved in cell wall biosynthesis